MRYEQFERIVITAQVLQELRFGASIEEVNRDVSERMGIAQPCERTTRRDLDFLERLGLVEHFAPGRYRWDAAGGFWDAVELPPSDISEGMRKFLMTG